MDITITTASNGSLRQRMLQDMKLRDIVPTLEELMLSNTELGCLNAAYIARVQPFLPEFPAEVLGSWFSEHPKALETYYPLGLENFRFHRHVKRSTLRPG